jgi:hypothetical protein
LCAPFFIDCTGEGFGAFRGGSAQVLRAAGGAGLAAVVVADELDAAHFGM